MRPIIIATFIIALVILIIYGMYQAYNMGVNRGYSLGAMAQSRTSVSILYELCQYETQNRTEELHDGIERNYIMVKDLYHTFKKCFGKPYVFDSSLVKLHYNTIQQPLSDVEKPVPVNNNNKTKPKTAEAPKSPDSSPALSTPTPSPKAP